MRWRLFDQAELKVDPISDNQLLVYHSGSGATYLLNQYTMDLFKLFFEQKGRQYSYDEIQDIFPDINNLSEALGQLKSLHLIKVSGK